MKRFKVLEVNNVIEEVTGHFNCTHSSYTKSCVVKDLETGEIISIDEKTASGIKAVIINKVDDGDCVVGDEFIIRD